MSSKSNTVPSAEQIKTEGISKLRPIKVEPWIAAHLSDVWQDMIKEIKASIKCEKMGRSGSSHTSLSTLASAHSRS